MDAADFIRQRIYDARREARLSQAELAQLIDSSQSSVSDVERGRVQTSAPDLLRIAEVLSKPVAYFLPPGAEAQTDREAELLSLFRSVPERWQNRMLGEVEKLIELRRRVQPYERAGIPEEFYEHLLWEELERMELEEAAQAGPPQEGDLGMPDWRRRYDQWKAENRPDEE
jgi:transcriptional regulator with XRE-family HTH domain